LDILPETSTRAADLVIPDWAQVIDLSLSATNALGHFHLIGWDIGLSDHGPVIVEANGTPDLNLHQIADGSGMATPTFNAFVVFCNSERKRMKASKKVRNRRIMMKEMAQLKAHSSLRKGEPPIG